MTDDIYELGRLDAMKVMLKSINSVSNEIFTKENIISIIEFCIEQIEKRMKENEQIPS